MGAPIGWIGLQGPVDHFGHPVVLIGAGPTGEELAVETFQVEFSLALAPIADGHARQSHPLGDVGVGFTGAAGQNDLRALHD